MSDDSTPGEGADARQRRTGGRGDEPADRSRGDDAGGGKAGSASDSPATETPPTPVTQQIGRVVVLLLLILFGVFAASNAQPVDFSWVFGETQITRTDAGETEGGVPLIILLLASFAIGAIVGSLVARQAGRSRRRAAPPTSDADPSRPRRSRG